MRQSSTGSFYIPKLALLALLCGGFVLAQPSRQFVQQYLNEHRASLGLSAEDVQHWTISDQYQNPRTGAWHIYLQQTLDGQPVWGAVSSCAVKDGQVAAFNSRFVPHAATLVDPTPHQRIDEVAAIEAATAHLGLATPPRLSPIASGKASVAMFAGGTLSRTTIEVQPVWMLVGDGLEPAWNVNLRPFEGSDWWNVRIHAATGKFLQKNNWVTHCAFGQHAFSRQHTCGDATACEAQQAVMQPFGNTATSATYNVFPFPVESPNHGQRQVLADPADPIASPFGWHDTDGVTGAEYQITRGNNVYAYEDRNDDDQPGYSPSGGSNLTFDFPLNMSQAPITYQDAAITNLFYVNNVMHDVWQQYGFDENSGNFQSKNYTNQGLGGDWVEAQAQDGGGTDNANMATPPDGQNPQMQMYLWTGGAAAGDSLRINSPGGVAGSYLMAQAGFGPGITSTITADLVLANDGTAPTSDGCSAFVNAAAVAGKIAVLDRGNCSFGSKVLEAQNAGAVAAIVINNAAGAPFAMGGGVAGITIPSVMISQADGNLLKASMAGNTVNGTLSPSGGNSTDLDGDFDNGIVAHEYTHGISNRLTGGPSNTSCLSNMEQMGEGWSDYYAVVMTIRPGDTKNTSRGMGTFAIREPITGVGIRDYPYAVDMSVNPFTYTDIQGVSVPHGVGSVWCTMLWDMTWSLIDSFGYNPDLYYGTGGNNIAMNLVTQGLALQPCNPGFVDGRNAILQADDLLYGGVHKCQLWKAFARRGLGYSASQGSSDVLGDETEAFDLPPFCLAATVAPTASFVADVTETCLGQIAFTDLSTNIAQSWHWDFGDGATSTLQNPTHTYTSGGQYTVTLIVQNTIGADTLVASNYIAITKPAAPVVSNASVFVGQKATLTTAPTSGGDIRWYDASGVNMLGSGNTFVTQTFTAAGSYDFTTREVLPEAVSYVGAASNAIGGGGYHATAFTGQLIFDAYKPFTLISAWVDAGSAGSRDIYLWDDAGNVVDMATVSIPAGQSRVALGLKVPAAGAYRVGGTNLDLYRNNGGAQYPYTVPGVVSITGSNATNSPQTYYYYLYDWEVQPDECIGDLATITVIVNTEVATDPARETGISVRPNPAHAEVTVALTGDETLSRVTLYNAAGQMVSDTHTNGQQSLTLPLNTLAPGVYAVRVVAGDRVTTTRLVVE